MKLFYGRTFWIRDTSFYRVVDRVDEVVLGFYTMDYPIIHFIYQTLIIASLFENPFIYFIT